MKLFILCTRFLDFESKTQLIGGIQTYLRNLIRLAESQGYALDILQVSEKAEEYRLTEDGRIRVIGVPSGKKHFIRDLISKAEESGDPARDVLIFATSTQIEKHSFRNSIGIQHGIYWDVPTVHGKRPPFPLDLSLRAAQAKKIISQHRLVSRMVCVDYNYVNWLRALTVDRSLAYTVIPNASDLPALNPGREDGSVRLIFARRFETIRGVDLIMDLLPRLFGRYSNLYVTLAGGGSREEELKTFFQNTDRVSFLCYSPEDSLRVHQDFDIAIVPTIGSEGTSLSLLEAMAAGCAVVCSDIGGMSNLILDRFNGRIVQPSSDEFYVALCELIEDRGLRERLAAKGRETVVASFSMKTWEDRWCRVLRDISR